MGLFRRKDRGGRKGVWYGSFMDHRGKQIKFSTKTTDKQTAEAVLAKRRAQAAEKREGLTNKTQERFAKYAKMPIQEHLEAYIASLRSDGRSEIYITRQESRIQKIFRSAGFRSLSDIELTEVQQTINKMRTGKDKRPFSATTRKHWIQAIKGFTSWLTKSGQRLPADPLVALKRPNGNRDRRLVRRALLVEEWQVIKSLLPSAGDKMGMPAAERLLIYELAIQTGLRAGEIYSLTKGRLHLAGSTPTVVVPSDITKDARDAHQGITTELATKLRKHVSGRSPNSKVFSMPKSDSTAKLFRGDVNFVCDEWRKSVASDPTKQVILREHPEFLSVHDSNGSSLDFHALRHTCGAWLALAGVHTKTIQSVMRHKDVKLTLDTYGHLFKSMEREALTKMEGLLRGEDSLDICPEIPVANHELRS